MQTIVITSYSIHYTKLYESDDDLQLLKDITATLKITDAGYQNVDTYTQRIECDALTLVLTDEWIETSEGENGYYDYGYYGSFTA